MKHIITMLLTALALQASAQVKTEIGKFNLAGPYAVAAPFATDTVDVKGKKFDNNSLLSALPQDCLFSRIIDYRGTDLADVPDGQKDFYRKMKRRYALPLPRSEQEKNDAITAALMNGGDLTGVL